jgi:hypothetical protein
LMASLRRRTLAAQFNFVNRHESYFPETAADTDKWLVDATATEAVFRRQYHGLSAIRAL